MSRLGQILPLTSSLRRSECAWQVPEEEQAENIQASHRDNRTLLHKAILRNRGNHVRDQDEQLERSQRIPERLHSEDPTIPRYEYLEDCQEQKKRHTNEYKVLC